MEKRRPNYRPIHCERCGVLCERTNPTQRYCVACREIVRREQHESWHEAHSNGGRGKPRFHYQKGRGKEGGPEKLLPPPDPLRGRSLQEVARAARQAGMSYGRFVAACGAGELDPADLFERQKMRRRA